MTWRPAGYLAYCTSEDRAQLHAGGRARRIGTLRSPKLLKMEHLSI
jgi:hypothetical protein